MTHLDFERLVAIDAQSFQSQEPYPWLNPMGLLTAAGFQRLLETLPAVSCFEQHFGVTRAHGQPSHDRYVLEYRDGLGLAQPWQDFIAELRSERYRAFLCRLFGVRSLWLNFHWHYTPAGCAVSPHCDNKRKLGSHIFYFNTESDWDPAWGGETVILDDGGRLTRRSAPGFEDFDRAIPATALGNRSLLFERTARSWHGVRALNCPEGHLRKVFIVVINRMTPVVRMRRWLGLPEAA